MGPGGAWPGANRLCWTAGLWLVPSRRAPAPGSHKAGAASQTAHLNSSIKACRNVRKLLCLLMLESSSRAMFPNT